MWSTLNDLHSANYHHAGLKLGCKAVTDAHEWYLQSGERKKMKAIGWNDLPRQRSDLRMLPTCLQREPPEIWLHIQHLLEVNVH